MTSIMDQINELDKKKIRSKVKFSWDFHKELETLIEKVEEAIKKQIIPNYWVEYTEYGTYSIKVKIKLSTQLKNQ